MRVVGFNGSARKGGNTAWLLNIGIGREIGDVEKDEEGVQTMRTLGRNMAWASETSGRGGVTSPASRSVARGGRGERVLRVDDRHAGVVEVRLAGDEFEAAGVTREQFTERGPQVAAAARRAVAVDHADRAGVSRPQGRVVMGGEAGERFRHGQPVQVERRLQPFRPLRVQIPCRREPDPVSCVIHGSPRFDPSCGIAKCTIFRNRSAEGGTSQAGFL